ncbi:tyrosine-type recombinase/integrase [Runella zeae]|uniref:tyrosine-type recombinase/integrase n=1 Tax=Runella zeae TaxID=94255 RepID=UPI002356DC81|nr:tyrosine-type recombinase/integrase [Runella zeae]
MANLHKKPSTLPKPYFKIRVNYLHLAIRYAGKESNYRSTGIKIDQGERWHNPSRSIIPNDQKTALVRQIEANLGDIFYTFKAKRQSISADMLLDYVTNKRDWTTDIPNLLGTIDAYIESRRDELESGIICKITFGRFIVRRQNTAEFLARKYKTNHLPLDQIQPIICTEYKTFLKTQKRYGKEVVNKDLGFMKRVFSFAVMNGWTDRNVFESYKPEVVERSIKALNLKEVRQMMNLSNLDPTTDRVRWVFLFSCFCGLNHSDMRVLKPKHLETLTDGKIVLRQPRTKNNRSRVTPLPPIALNILKMYESHCEKTGFLLPTELPQDANDRLKVLQAQMKLERFPLTTRIGRATFSTLLANLGVPTDILKNATGHSNTQTLRKHYTDYYDETTINAVWEAWNRMS